MPVCILSVIQGDQTVSVHLTITVQKQKKLFYTVSIMYHDIIVIIRDNRCQFVS
jgi:hypothetical protein